MTLTVQERVANGVVLLDEKRPGWDSIVRLDDFNLWDGEKCILGQLFNSYARGVVILNLNFESTAMDYGFNAPATSVHAREVEMYALESEWSYVIAERREKVMV